MLGGGGVPFTVGGCVVRKFERKICCSCKGMVFCFCHAGERVYLHFVKRAPYVSGTQEEAVFLVRKKSFLQNRGLIS